MDSTPEYDKYVWWVTQGGQRCYVTPIVVGVHGQPVNFLTSGAGRVDTLEYNGREDVAPESLYEAQLELRLGYLPEWVREIRKEAKF